MSTCSFTQQTVKMRFRKEGGGPEPLQFAKQVGPGEAREAPAPAHTGYKIPRYRLDEKRAQTTHIENTLKTNIIMTKQTCNTYYDQASGTSDRRCMGGGMEGRTQNKP